jgi:hypothetical protein
MFERIIVAYWVPNKSIEEKIGIPHNTVELYSDERRNEIINKALENKLQVMLKAGIVNHLILYVDDGRFRQR